MTWLLCATNRIKSQNTFKLHTSHRYTPRIFAHEGNNKMGKRMNVCVDLSGLDDSRHHKTSIFFHSFLACIRFCDFYLVLFSDYFRYAAAAFFYFTLSVFLWIVPSLTRVGACLVEWFVSFNFSFFRFVFVGAVFYAKNRRKIGAISCTSP